MSHRSRSVVMDPLKVVRVLGSIEVFLLLAHLVVQWIRFWGGHPYAYGIVPMFDLDEENNLPTWYSSSLLLYAALLAAMIGCFKTQERDAFARHWVALAIILLYLAIDEACGIHELLSLPTRRFIDGRGLLYHSWVVPGSAFVVLFAIVYRRFVQSLPVKTRWILSTAALIYILGALGIEMWGGRFNELFGRDNMNYRLLAMLEEGLEMTGVLMFTYGLLDYIRTNAYQVCFHAGARFGPP